MIASNGNIRTPAQSDAASDQGPNEVEAVLPWYAVGRLAAKDARQVEEALRQDPALARQLSVIQDEVTETIHLNESLGAPSGRAAQRLFAAIEAEPTRSQPVLSSVAMRIRTFLSELSPRTVALSAATAAALVLVQAGVIGTMLVKQPAGGTYQTASVERAAIAPKANDSGVQLLIRFAPDAKFSEVTTFLDGHNASIVSGPQAGMFRVQFGDKALSKDETSRLLTDIQADKVVGFAGVTE